MGILHTRATSDQRTSSRKRAIAGFTAVTLAVGGLSLSPLFTEVAEATTGAIYDTGGWHDAAAVDVYLAAGEKHAANKTPAPFSPIDSQTLYGSSSDNDGTVFTYARGGADPIPTGQVAIGYGHNVDKLTDNEFSTIAVDANPAGTRAAKYAYLWGYDAENDISDKEAAEIGITNYDKKLLEGYAPIFRATEGESKLDLLLIPSAKNFENVKDDDQGWSGGDVNQGTGDIVFSGPYDSLIGDGYRMMILNPTTLQYNYSGPLVPATPGDNIFHNTGHGVGKNGYVASDFALDANGNAYLTVTSTEAAPAFGLGAAKRVWLVRVVPSVGGDWTYNLITPLTAAPGQSKVVDNYVNRGKDLGDYGVAWYNGKLYVTEHDHYTLLEINPVSAQVYNLPHGSATPAKSGPVEKDVRDLASGQTAIVIQGSVYNDAAGDGSVAGDLAVPGQTVALYSKDANGVLTYEGQRLTGPSGDYTFLVSGYGDWVVRLVQPTLNARNAVQTWASAGGIANTTVAKCDSGDLGISGACSGALSSPFRPDPALPAIGTITPLEDLSFYTNVNITTSSEVINVDFGITTAGDYGDSPLGPPSAELGAPFHLNSVNPQLWLGANVGLTPGPSTDDSHATDDGVTVSSFYGDLPLAGTVLAANHQYNLKAAVSGPKTALANVRGWVAPGGSWVAAPAWSPTLVGATASGPFTYQTVGPVAPTGNLRVDASVVPSAAPTNPPGSYTVYPATGYWAVPGEVEDYTFNLAQAAYRPAAVTTGPTGTFAVGGQSLTAGSAPVFGVPTAATVGANVISVTVPDPLWTVAKAEALSVDTGAVLETLSVTGSGLNYSVSRNFASGEDVVILVTFRLARGQGSPDPDQSSLTVYPTTQQVGLDVTATATIKDAAGNLLPGTTVTFGATGNATLSAVTATTNANGQATVTLTDKKAETIFVTATVQVAGVDTPISGSPTAVTFTPGPICVYPCVPDPDVPNDRRTRVEVTANHALANNIHANTTTTWAFDKYGNAVTGATAHTSSPSATLRIPITHKAVLHTGTVDHDYHSYEVGDHNAHVFLDGQEITFVPQPGSALDNPADIALRSSPAKLTFRGGDIDAANSTLVVDPSTQEVGKNVTVTVTVRDTFNALVSGVDVTLGTSGNSVLGVTTATTDANGQVVTTLTDKKAETVQVTATVPVRGIDTPVSGSPAQVIFTAGPLCIHPCVPDSDVPNDRRTRLDVVVDGALADGKATDEVVAWAFDRYGNPVVDTNVKTTSLDAVLRVKDVAALTGADGSARITYVATAAGSHQASVTLNGQTVIFIPQPGSAWDNPKDQAAHSSPATLTFKAVSPKVQTGGSVLSSDQPVKAFKR